ncbi:hypothetical protein [Trichothermofontia sp.]
MDVYTQQLMALSAKIDMLYQLVDQIHAQIAAMPPVGSTSPEESIGGGPTALHRPPAYPSPHISNPQSHTHALELEHRNILLEHRDVLVDNDYVQIDNPGSDPSLTTEVQVQRLTAQLTAAYNRIAALEEQLLARRVHSH